MDQSRRQVELLAPAGSYESMMAAVAAGADAVYIGGALFGARAYADNPKEDMLLKAIDHVHLNGKKLYLTVNTLVKEREFHQLGEYLGPCYERGLDGVIVQDMGVFTYIRSRFPDLPVHASTQMTITGVYGAEVLASLGAARVVTARELSLEEIKRIHETVDIDIESFIHGALCYCYSGQCLFSSLIGGRSGNRGRCAQTCRLPYEIKCGKKTVNGKNEKYVLSLKDLCTLDVLPRLIEAGIYSLKIEGRMKSPRYTAGVVSIYRKYVDLYLREGDKGYHVEEKDRVTLLDLFDRGGQTDGYYNRHNGKDMVVWKEKPAFREGNEELFHYLDEAYLQKPAAKPVSGTVFLEEGKPSVLSLQMGDHFVQAEGEAPLAAQNQPLTVEKLCRQINKTGGTPFYFEALEGQIEGNVFLPLQALNELRRNGLEALETAVLKPYWRQLAKEEHTSHPESRISEAAFILGRRTDTARLSVSLEQPETLTEILKKTGIYRVDLDAAHFPPKDWWETVNACHEAGKKCYLLMPHIFRREAEDFFERNHEALSDAGFDGGVIRSMEEPGYLRSSGFKKPLLFDYGMYAMNRMAKAAMKELGADEFTLPLELNERELRDLGGGGELIVYGRLPMMVTAQCLHQAAGGCSKKTEITVLKDRMGKEFPVKNHCNFCYNTVYNSQPLSLLGLEENVRKLSPDSLRLMFTTESKEEAARICDIFQEAFSEDVLSQESSGQRKERDKLVLDYTRGHFKRGVE